MFAKMNSKPRRTAMERLLAFYNDPELSLVFSSVNPTPLIPGKEVCATLAQDAATPAPQKPEDIKREHVLKYLALATANDEDPVLNNQANILSIAVLLTKSTGYDKSNVRDLILRLHASKGATFATRPDNGELMAYLASAEVEPKEINTLYEDILIALRPSEAEDTRDALSYVQTGLKRPSAQNAMRDIMMAPINAAREALVAEERKQHAKKVADNPTIDLMEIDFTFETQHKAILREALLALKHPVANSPAVNPMYGKFNQLVRGVFADYPLEPNAEQRKQIDAKLKYTLGKLAGVLRRNNLLEMEEKVLDHLHPLTKGKNVVATVSKKGPSNNPLDPNFDPKKKSLVDSIIDRLDKLLGPKVEQGVASRLLGTFRSAPAPEPKTHKFVDVLTGKDQLSAQDKAKQPALPTEIKATIDAANLDDAQMQEFIARLRKNKDVGSSAERKLANRMLKLQAALQEITLEKELQAELDASLAKFDAKNEIHKINPVGDMYKNFAEGYKKLAKRVNLADIDANDKKKSYLSEENLASERRKAIEKLRVAMERTVRVINAEIAELTQQVGADVPESRRKVEAINRLEDMNNILPQAEAIQTKIKLAIAAHNDEDLAISLIEARKLKQDFDKENEKLLAPIAGAPEQPSEQQKAMQRFMAQQQGAQGNVIDAPAAEENVPAEPAAGPRI